MERRRTPGASRTGLGLRMGLALLGLAIGLATLLVCAGSASAEPDIWRAADFSGETLDGDAVSLDTYHGKPLVLLFWGSW